jgi:NAD(P)-dependent dehydrogenase (short-subunit alcohol dehydrogenase family)
MGRSIALTLAREGAKVVVNYRQSAEAAGEIIDYLHEKDREAIAVQADVINFEKCKKLVNKTIRKFGRVDICVISPGAGWHEETIDKLNVPDALEDITKEVAPFYHLMPLVLPGMYTRKWGRVIAMMRAVQETWQHGVTINVIAPGPVKETRSLREAIDLCEHGRNWLQRSTTTPQDIAEGVAFLCSEEGRFITGCELPYMYY